MNCISRVFRGVMIGCASMALLAGDYDHLVSVVRKAWPDRTTVAVVCNRAADETGLKAFEAAAGGWKVMVMDVKAPQDLGKALTMINSHKTDMVVLIAGDRVAGDGTQGATFIIQRLVTMKIPVVATTEAGAKQGAVIAAGKGTGGRVLVNPKFASLVGVGLPEGVSVN